MKREILYLLCLVPIALDGKAQEIGHVIEANGHWCDETYSDCKLSNYAPIGPLYMVRADSRLVRVGDLDGQEKLRLRSYATGAEIIYDCRDALDCTGPLDLRRTRRNGKADSAGNGLIAFLDVMRRMSSEHPTVWKTYSQGIFVPKGSSSTHLHNSVVKLAGSEIDLSSVFDGMPTGDYFVQICDVQGSGRVSCVNEDEPGSSFYCRSSSFGLLWHNNRTTLRSNLRSNQIHSGLVRISLCDGETHMITDSNAIALIADRDKYEGTALRFKQALDSLEMIDAGRRPDPTINAMQRIFLHYLASN